MKSLLVLFFVGVFFWGCGSQGEFKAPVVKKEINVTRSLYEVKREWGKYYVEHYLSKDNENLYVQVKSKELDYRYSLLHYDISRGTRFVKTIVELNTGPIKNVTPLKDNKLIYVRSDTKGYDYFVRIYDATLEKEIRAYEIMNDDALQVSEDETYFIKGDVVIDIEDIYQDNINFVWDDKDF